MRILLIGGGVFLGRCLISTLVDAGHSLTVFNRGRGYKYDSKAVQILVGDRDHDLDLLTRYRWDICIDTCCYFPYQAAATAKILKNRIEQYIFISSVNQYRDFNSENISENYPSDTTYSGARDLDIPLNQKTYGGLKAASEEIICSEFEGRALIIRPGCIVGPYDPAFRFGSLVRRIVEGGKMIIPGSPLDRWQIIDIRDLVKWIVALAERRACGVFNAVGPNGKMTIGQLVSEISVFAKFPLEPIWVNLENLTELPNSERWLYFAEWSSCLGWARYIYSISNQRALEQGLTFCRLEDTVRFTLLSEKIGIQDPFVDIWDVERSVIDRFYK